MEAPVFILLSFCGVGAIGYIPEFLSVIKNLTITEGRDASFACTVENLGGHRVAWIKSDTKVGHLVLAFSVVSNPGILIDRT